MKGLKAKKILFIEEVSGYGGSSVCVVNLLKLIPHDKFIKSLITYFSDANLFNKEAIRLDGLYLLNKLRFRSRFSIVNNIGFILEGVRRIIQTVLIIRKDKPDLIHLNNSLGINFYSIIAAKLCGIPCVAHVRNFEETHMIQRIALKYVSKIIAISQCVFDFMSDDAKSKATIIYDGLLEEELEVKHSVPCLKSSLGIGERDKIVAFVGMLNEWKGVDVFIKAIKAVLADNSNVIGVIFGDEVQPITGYKNQLIAMISELGLEKNIIFAGLRKDIKEIYPSLDIVVHASITPEPFGRVIIEAMAAARPVIATNIGGPKELIEHGVTGMLYEPGNFQELSSIVNELLIKPDFAMQIGNKAQNHVQDNFRIENTVAQTLRVYEEVLGSKQ